MNSWVVYLLGVATLPAAYVLIGAVDRSCVWIARRWVRVVCGHYEFRDGYESKRIRVWRPTGTHRSGCVVTVRLTRTSRRGFDIGVGFRPYSPDELRARRIAVGAAAADLAS